MNLGIKNNENGSMIAIVNKLSYISLRFLTNKCATSNEITDPVL